MSARLGHVDWQLQLGDYLSALAVSPDGDLLVAGSLAGDVVLVETEGGAVVAKLHDHALGALAIDWSPDGERLVVGGQDAVARVYDRQGAELGAVTTDGWADRLAWSPTDDLLAVAGGRQLVLTDRNGGVVRRHDDVASTITDVVWATNGRRVGAAAYGGIAWYDPDDDDTLPRRFHRWKGSLLAVALSPDGKWACAGAQDASIHIWKLWSGDELAMSGYFSKIEHLAFSADSRWLACSCLELLTWWDFFGKGPATPHPPPANSTRRPSRPWRGSRTASCWSPEEPTGGSCCGTPRRARLRRCGRSTLTSPSPVSQAWCGIPTVPGCSSGATTERSSIDRSRTERPEFASLRNTPRAIAAARSSSERTETAASTRLA